MKTIATALFALACALCSPLCAAQTTGHTFLAYRHATASYGPMVEAYKETRPLQDRRIVECALLKDDAEAFEDLACDEVTGPTVLTTEHTEAITRSMDTFIASHFTRRSSYGVPCVLPKGMPSSDVMDLCDSQVRGKITALASGQTGMIATRLDRQLVYCAQIKAKLSVQLDAAAAGRAGYYNLDTLQTLERQACGTNGNM